MKENFRLDQTFVGRYEIPWIFSLFNIISRMFWLMTDSCLIWFFTYFWPSYYFYQRPKSITSVSRSKSITSWRLLHSKPTTSPQHKRQVHSKSVTSWFGQKSALSVVSCYFPNSITTTCCQLIGRVADKSATSWQLPRLCGSYGEMCVMAFGLKGVTS